MWHWGILGCVGFYSVCLLAPLSRIGVGICTETHSNNRNKVIDFVTIFFEYSWIHGSFFRLWRLLATIQAHLLHALHQPNSNLLNCDVEEAVTDVPLQCILHNLDAIVPRRFIVAPNSSESRSVDRTLSKSMTLYKTGQLLLFYSAYLIRKMLLNNLGNFQFDGLVVKIPIGRDFSSKHKRKISSAIFHLLSCKSRCLKLNQPVYQYIKSIHL